MHLRAETPPPRRAQPAAGGDDAWTSSPLPRPMKIPEESCFSSPKPFSSPTPLCHSGKENVRPLQVPLASQTPVKTPSRLPTVKEQEGQMPSLVEADTLPVYVPCTPTPMKEALDFSDMDGELLLPKVKHTFYNFDTPLRMVDNMRSPPKSAPPGCAPPGLDPPDSWGLFGGPLPAAPPMPIPSAVEVASQPALLAEQLSGQPSSPRQQQGGDVRRLDLAKYLDVPAAASSPGSLPPAMADSSKCQGQAWMDWQCMQGGMVLPQPLELPIAGDYPTDGQCWGTVSQTCSAMPTAAMQDGMAMAQSTGIVLDSMTMTQSSGLVLDAALQSQQQQLTMEQVQAQMQAQMQMQQQQPQPAVTMQQMQALMQFWQMPYQSTTTPAMQAPAAAPDLAQQLQLPLPMPPQVPAGTCPSASEQLMSLPQILAETPSMPGTEHRECLFLCGAPEPMGYNGASCGDRPAFPAPEAPPPAVTLAQTPQPPRVNICVSHFPPPSTPAHAPEAAATPPPPQQPPQQPPAAGGSAAGGGAASGGGEAGPEAAAKEEAKPPAGAKGSTPSGGKPSRRRRAR